MMYKRSSLIKRQVLLKIINTEKTVMFYIYFQTFTIYKYIHNVRNVSTNIIVFLLVSLLLSDIISQRSQSSQRPLRVPSVFPRNLIKRNHVSKRKTLAIYYMEKI